MDVAVVGSLSFDMVFQVPRRPEKGETVKGFSFETFVGGKGNNQALAADKAGAKTAIVGKVGKDSYADLISDELKKNQVNQDALFQDQEQGTGLANIYVDPDGDNSIIIVPRANQALSPKDIEKAIPILEKTDLVMLQLEIDLETTVYAAKLARSLGKQVLLNPAPAPEDGNLPKELLENLDYFIPNESEAGLLVGEKIDSIKSANKALEKLTTLINGTVLITLGEKGVVGRDKGGDFYQTSPFSVNAIDTTAAGDAFLGCFAQQIISGASLEKAMEAASAAGALATTKAGAVPSLPTKAEISKLIDSRHSIKS